MRPPRLASLGLVMAAATLAPTPWWSVVHATRAPHSTNVTEPTDPTIPPTQTIEIGTSVEGRPLTIERRGTQGGRKVLIIGVIHGDEQAGLQIVDRLRRLPVPEGVDLYLLDAMNPDGVAANQRGNANGVDLNRNFPYQWAPLAEPGDWQWAGVGPASEPETQAVMAFIDAEQPDLVIWYHQDYFRISPSQGRDGAIRARYSELSGVPLLPISGGTYTGVAATWARHALDGGVAFIVELADTLSDAEAEVHAQAVLTVASEPN